MLRNRFTTSLVSGLVLSLLLIGCTEIVDQKAQDAEGSLSDVQLALSYSPENFLPSQVTSGEMQIIAGNDILKEALVVTNSSINGSILDVPVGESYTLVFTLYDANGTVLYVDQSSVSVDDQTTLIEISLEPTLSFPNDSTDQGTNPQDTTQTWPNDSTDQGTNPQDTTQTFPNDSTDQGTNPQDTTQTWPNDSTDQGTNPQDTLQIWPNDSTQIWPIDTIYAWPNDSITPGKFPVDTMYVDDQGNYHI